MKSCIAFNDSEELILDKVVRRKMQNVSILEEQGICSKNQIKSDHLEEKFPNLVTLSKMDLDEPATNEDLKTGFELYHAQ